MSFGVYVTALAERFARGQELAAAGMPGGIADSNAAAGEGRGAGDKHASAQRYVHPGRHNAAERAVLCIVVSTQEVGRYSVGGVQAVGREAAAV